MATVAESSEEPVLGLSEVRAILLSLLFTALLWLKLDHGEQTQWLPWGCVLLPLWAINLFSARVTVRRLLSLRARHAGLPVWWWPQTSKNVASLAAENTVEELASAAAKLLLLLCAGTDVPFAARLAPLWVAAACTPLFYMLRKPRVGVTVKPSYVAAFLILTKLDGHNNLSWGLLFGCFQFALLVLMVASFFFLSNVRKARMHPSQRTVSQCSALFLILVCACVSSTLSALARYLSPPPLSFLRINATATPAQVFQAAAEFAAAHPAGVSSDSLAMAANDFLETALLAAASHAAMLLGVVAVAQCIRRSREEIRRLRLARRLADEQGDRAGADADELDEGDLRPQRQTSRAKESDVAIELDFVAGALTEHVFLRHSANLFKRLPPSTSQVAAAPRAEDFDQASDSQLECVDDQECVICCEEGARYIVLECGHGNFCKDCCSGLAKLNLCPLCREPITSIGELDAKGLKRKDGGSTLVRLNSIAHINRSASASASAESASASAVPATATSRASVADAVQLV